MENVLEQILKKLDMIEADISELKAKNCNIETDVSDIKQSVGLLVGNKEPIKEPINEPIKETKKATKEFKLEYSDLLINFFREKNVEYDIDQDVERNMANLCNELDTNIKINCCGKVIYQNKDVHTHVENCTLTNKEGIKLARNKIVCNNPLPITVFDMNNKANADKDEFEKCCKLLNIKTTYNLFDIRTKVLQKMVSHYGLEGLTDEERFVCDRDNIRGDVKYLIENNYELANSCYSYDINSFHAAVLMQDCKYPIRAGTRKYVEHIDTNVFGLYAIKTDDIGYFKPKDDNKVWYSSEYIKMLDKEGIGYELVRDLEYNAIVYNDYDLMSGHTLFKEYIELLYSEKQNKLCKHLLSSIVGHMNGGKKKIEKTKMMEDLTIDDLLNFKKCKKVAFNERSVTLEDRYMNKYNYTFDTARFKPFLYDYFKIYLWTKYIKKYDLDGHIIRLCTDSFLIHKKLKNCDDIGDDIGMIKPELYLKKGLIYPDVNHSFKTNGVLGMTFVWDKGYVNMNGTIGAYVQTPIKPINEQEEQHSEDDA